MNYECYYDHSQKCWIAVYSDRRSASHPTNKSKAIETLEKVGRNEFVHMATRTVPRIDVRV